MYFLFYNLDSSHSQILLCFCKPSRQVSDLYGHYITAIVLILLYRTLQSQDK